MPYAEYISFNEDLEKIVKLSEDPLKSFMNIFIHDTVTVVTLKGTRGIHYKPLLQ